MATACAGAESKPARDPASGEYSPAPTDGNPNNSRSGLSSTTGASVGEPVAPAPKPAVAPATVAPVTGTLSPPASGNVAAAAEATSPDNTKVNERDRRGSTLTPLDQGNSASETKISAAIRRGIMGDGALSFTAKNVKVITIGTRVTLRGPVKSDHEKAAIDALARRTEGVTDVDNQLEVKK